MSRSTVPDALTTKSCAADTVVDKRETHRIERLGGKS